MALSLEEEMTMETFSKAGTEMIKNSDAQEIYSEKENSLNTSEKSENYMTEPIETIYDQNVPLGIEKEMEVPDIKLMPEDEKNLEKVVKKSQPEDNRTRDEIIDEIHKRVYSEMRENPKSLLYKERGKNQINLMARLKEREEGIDDAHKKTYASMKENPRSLIYTGRQNDFKIAREKPYVPKK